jgi:hypothetical protein
VPAGASNLVKAIDDLLRIDARYRNGKLAPFQQIVVRRRDRWLLNALLALARQGLAAPAGQRES